MLFDINKDKKVEFDHIYIHIPIKNDAMSDDFPLRSGDMWKAEVVLDTGEVLNWPKGRSGTVDLKVVGIGSYILTGPKYCYEIECDYVPDGVVPGEWGDYIFLEINEDGIITNWPTPENIDIGKFLSYD